VKDVATCLLTYFTYLLGRLSCLVTRTKIYRFALLCGVLLCLAMPCHTLPGGKEEGSGGGREGGERK